MNEQALLRKNLGEYFSQSELEGMAFDFGIDYDNLRRGTKPEFVMDLINFMGRSGRISELVRVARKERPHAPWPNFAPTEATPTKFEIPPNATMVFQGNVGSVHIGDNNLSGDFRNAIVNNNATLTNVQQQISSIPHGSQDEKEQLRQLIEQLKIAIDSIPESQASNVEEDVKAVGDTSKALVEFAVAEQPSKTMLNITGEGLKKAAENLAAVSPTVLTIATQIVATIARIVGG